MENITFKYFDKQPLELLLSDELKHKIEFVQLSRVDKLPVYQTICDFVFDEDVIHMLNYNEMDKLKIILRSNKLNKILNKKPTLKYEFLDFWLHNSEKLRIMIPI